MKKKTIPETGIPPQHPQKRKGVAIITVLAVMLLMTILTVGFLQLATNQVTNSRTYADGLKVRWMKDIALNMVIAQIREATNQLGSAWASQPGAIRSFEFEPPREAVETGIIPSTIYKLYSAKNMITATVSQVEVNDLRRGWENLQDEWVDLNAPVEDANGNIHFPIADPRAANASLRGAGNEVRGFRYDTSKLSGFSAQGVDLLPMPVTWMYILKDGTVGYLSSARRFIGDRKPTRDNPIIGRIGFWTDDESAKVNVNTASEGIYWDQPRANTPEDRLLAKTQPVQGEVQRYPGHPATTCLSPIFAPQIVHDLRNPEREWERFKQIYDVSPVVSLEGSRGAQDVIDERKWREQFQSRKDTHLLASIDELAVTDEYFNSQREEVNWFNPYIVSQSKFFLTTKSRAPEVSLHGQPRMCVWPMHDRGDGAQLTRSTNFDRLVAHAATVSKGLRNQAIYFFQRADTNSRHGEFYNRAGGRNARCFDWLTYVVENRTIPGWGRSFGSKYGTGEISETRQILNLCFDYIRDTNLYDANLRQASDQYAYGGSTENRGQVAGICMCGGTGPHQTNWNSPRATPKGYGRIHTVGEIGILVTAGGKKTGGAAGIVEGRDGPYPAQTPEGFTDYLLEIGLMVEGVAPSHGWTALAPFSVVQLSGGADNRLGNDALPITIKVGNETFTADPPRSTTTESAMRARAAGSISLSRPEESDWIGWGGTGGPRMFGGVRNGRNYMITYQDVVVRVPGNSATATIDMHEGADLQEDGTYPRNRRIRLIVYDAAVLNDVNNLVQSIEMRVPAFNVTVSDQLFNRSWADTADRANLKVLDLVMRDGAGDLERFRSYLNSREIFVRTLVPNHGDYRLVASPRLVDYESFAPFPDWDTFVNSPDQANLHAFTEPIATNALGTTFGGRRGRSLLVVPAGIPGAGQPLEYNPESAPDFPVNPDNESYARFNTRALTAASIQLRNQGISRTSEDFRRQFDPTNTGDFDNGIGPAPDGAWVNRPDDGFIGGMDKGDRQDGLRGVKNVPYFDPDLIVGLNYPRRPEDGRPVYSPNKIIPSPGMFGSLSTGIQGRIPWQTLLFRPQQINATGQARHYGSFTPPDHLILDLFWMPVVEPYAISEPFSTAGKINMNYQILPFTYIRRATGLHAIMKSERMMAIPNEYANRYKLRGDDGITEDVQWRYPISIEHTLTQFENRFKEGGFFRAPSEICEMWLVPADPDLTNVDNLPHPDINLPDDPDGVTVDRLEDEMATFWKRHVLTGDNTRERPYVNMYPRLTTRSNVFKVHVIVETIQKARGSDPDEIDTERRINPDIVTGRYRGSAVIERKIDTTEDEIPDFAANPATDETLDQFYSFRITNDEQFAP